MKRIIKASYNLDPTGEIGEAWDKLIDLGISEEALHLVTDLNGYSVDTLNNVARARFGLDLNQLDEGYE